jgi:two-component system, cell cycle sensor histidine kinase and response regulator CckA
LSSPPDRPADSSPEPEKAGFDAPGGTETVLIVDDEPLVLRLCGSILSRQGYSVLSAGGADEALRQIEDQGSNLNLLLSDIVMPRMRGTDLADRILSRYPGVRVLYMSGFDGRDIPEYERLKRSARLIRKPFTPRDLLVAVRAALDKPAAL